MTYDLYVITDEVISGGRSHEEIASLAIAGGADVIQLRDKRIGGRALLTCALKVREITRKSGKIFIVNDRLDIALAARSDGVHLGKDDLPVRDARKLAPPGFIIGISVSTPDDAERAVSDGADYCAVSPVFMTTSKDDAGKTVGIAGIKEIRSRISVPLVAIGGITRKNLYDVIMAGADGIAVISAVVAKPDITEAVRELRLEIARAKEARSV